MSNQVDNTISKNSLENKSQISTEPTEEGTSSNVDFLSSSLKEIAEKEPKTEEEFYKASFEVFKELNESIKSFNGRSLSEKELNEIQLMISSYPDILNSYQPHSENKQQIKDDIDIWELVIILFFSPQNNNKKTVQSLSFWLNDVDPIVPGESGFDWISLSRNILRANMEEAIDQLDSYNFEDIEKETIQLLETTLNQYKGLETSESFYDWRETCQKQLSSIQEIHDREFKIKENIILIFNLLLGVPYYIIKTGTFFDQLLGTAHYSQFYASTTEIALMAEELNYAHPKDRCARVCTTLLLNHIEDALDFCGKDSWMQTHLGHIFLAFGILKEEHIENNSEEEDVIVDPIYYAANYYAIEIAEKYNMWSEAIVYISICDTNRVVWVKKLLESPKAKDISLLQNALQTVDECSIVQANSYIHRMIGELYEEKDDVYLATLEYGEAQDVEKLDKIGTNIFNSYLKTGKWGGVVSGHDELTISTIYDSVMQYNTLRHHLENQELEEASRIAMNLLTSNKLPDEYKSIVFTDEDNILSVKQQYYNQEELVKLLDILDRVAKSNSTSFHSDTDIEKIREKLSYKAFTALA